MSIYLASTFANARIQRLVTSFRTQVQNKNIIFMHHFHFLFLGNLPYTLRQMSCSLFGYPSTTTGTISR